MLIKSYETTFKTLGEGAVLVEADLARINRYALEPLTAEQVYVRRMRLCNDRVDRSFERFPVSYLERFAETLPGKALLANHATGSRSPAQPPALGRFFKAELEQEAGVTYLVPSFYMVRLGSNEEARQQIDGGVWSHVSIGAFVDKRFCDLCGKDYDAYEFDEQGSFTGCRHLKGRAYNGQVCRVTYGGDLAKVEAVEGSIVWLGAQYGAEMSKSGSLGAGCWVMSAEGRPWSEPSTQHPAPSTRVPWRDKEAMMETEKGEGRPVAADLAPEQRVLLLQRDLGARESLLQAARQSVQLAAETEQAHLAEIAELKRFAPDGRLYRADLAAEMKRLAGLVGAEKECSAILTAAADRFDAARLKELVGEYQARFEKAFPPSGAGTPSPAKAAAADVRAPRSHTVI